MIVLTGMRMHDVSGKYNYFVKFIFRSDESNCKTYLGEEATDIGYTFHQRFVE